jgi:uncharacterized protein with von Willebrand factor type A (vWA) domain
MSQLAENVVHFGRLLRSVGLPVGPDRVVNALTVLNLVGVKRRDDVQEALASVLVDRHENRPVFDAAFEAFWHHPEQMQTSLAQILQASAGKSDSHQTRERVEHARLEQALKLPSLPQEASETTIADATATYSDIERLRGQDFASMNADEFAAATRLIQHLQLPLKPIRSRRRQHARRGEIDLRATTQQMLRSPDTLLPVYRNRGWRQPPLVVLLDISGSMERYARMFLHFAHALMRRYHQVETLVFGTRLTNVSRYLRDRDVDVALDNATRNVQDWHGGTRIGHSLGEFNRQWARRSLTGNASLVLVTDGLDRDQSDELAVQAARLRRYAREIIWLNPLLRYDDFQPKATGIRTLLPMVDHFLPVHNVNSLARLEQQLRLSTSERNFKNRKTAT